MLTGTGTGTGKGKGKGRGKGRGRGKVSEPPAALSPGEARGEVEGRTSGPNG
jgi:hypothetical protein